MQRMPLPRPMTRTQREAASLRVVLAPPLAIPGWTAITADLEARAYHEAGHVVVAWYAGWPVEGAAVVLGEAPIERLGSWCGHDPPERAQWKDRAIVAIAGYVAERLATGRETSLSDGDQYDALAVASRAVHAPNRATRWAARRAYVGDAADRAVIILRPAWSTVQALARALLATPGHRLGAGEVQAIMAGAGQE